MRKSAGVVAAAIALLFAGCSGDGGNAARGSSDGMSRPIDLEKWVEIVCGGPPASRRDGSRLFDRCYQSDARLSQQELSIGLLVFIASADQAHRAFEAAIERAAGEVRLQDEVLYAVNCQPDLDYGAAIYGTTDLIIDVLRERMKFDALDKVLPLRPGSAKECQSRDPKSRQDELFRRIKIGVAWRRDAIRAAIDRRLRSGDEQYLVEAAIADIVRYYYATSINDGLNGWRDRERAESLDTLAALKQKLGRMMDSNLSPWERCDIAGHLARALRSPPWRRLFSDAAADAIAVAGCR